MVAARDYRVMGIPKALAVVVKARYLRLVTVAAYATQLVARLMQLVPSAKIDNRLAVAHCLRPHYKAALVLCLRVK